jgi:hypothetical protein
MNTNQHIIELQELHDSLLWQWITALSVATKLFRKWFLAPTEILRRFAAL